MTKLTCITLLMLFQSLAIANDEFNSLQPGAAYKEAKQSLIAKGWQPLKNVNIKNSSLYAQDIYDEGSTEVLDCISMELDACRFRFTKDKQLLEVKTITRQLTVDSYTIIKK